MGIIVSDEIVLKTGMTCSNYYVNVDDIHITKSNVNDFKFDVSCKANYYTTEQSRRELKEKLYTCSLFIAVNDLANIHTQLYDELKLKFQSFQDVLEE